MSIRLTATTGACWRGGCGLGIGGGSGIAQPENIGIAHMLQGNLIDFDIARLIGKRAFLEENRRLLRGQTWSMSKVFEISPVLPAK
jgi:hypothetical protein